MSIEERHATDCASHRGKRCNCVARYRGEVRDARGRKVRSAWSTSRAQAISWEKEAMVAVRHGRLRASTPTTVRQAGIALVAGMRSGAILDRSGKPYKPKTVRGYEHGLKTYIYPLLGSRKVSSLRRADIQGFVEEMRALGAAPSTVHNRLDPLRVIVRRSIDNDELLVDPCARLKMPVVRNARTRIESSTTAEALIAALPESEQAFWALALFAGVRRGELRGLQVDDIDFDAGLVRVRRGWEPLDGGDAHAFDECVCGYDAAVAADQLPGDEYGGDVAGDLVDGVDGQRGCDGLHAVSERGQSGDDDPDQLRLRRAQLRDGLHARRRGVRCGG